MTTTLIVAIVLFGGVMAIMAVGVIFSGKRLRGSCGGVGSCQCRADGIPPESCTRDQDEPSPAG